jgi:trimeric autotransporter adhesin
MLRDRTLRCALLFVLLAAALPAQNVITTIAGVDPSFTGNGQPALNVPIGFVNGVTTDGAGNVYFTDPLEHMVLEVSASGTLTVVAGNGIAGYSGDGGPATSAAIAASDNPDQYVGAVFEDSLGGIVVDKQGNIYFGDGHRVRLVAADGTISTVAGGGTASPGDGGPATEASLGIVNGIALDEAGNLYFCESNRIRKMTPDGTLTTFAGSAASGFSGDGGPATAALLAQPEGLAFDGHGNLYVADGDVLNFPSRIREIAVNGTINTLAGGGSVFPANGVAPLSLSLPYASGLAVDATNALYVFAPKNGYLLKISGGTTTLITSPIAAAFQSNLPASTAFVVGQRVYDNSGIAFDAAGNLYVADSRDGRLCKIDTHGILTTLAGNGNYGFGGDGGPALGAMIQGPSGMTQTPDGTLYFLDTLNTRVRAIAPNGTISTVISSATFPALGVFELLNAITSDPGGNVYVLLAHRVIELMTNGSIQIIVNQAGGVASSGDGGPATAASIESGGGLARDAAGNLYIADLTGDRIRKLTPNGIINTIAGTGVSGVSPDGAVAAKSPLSGPSALLPDSQGGLYFEEQQTLVAGGNVLRYITPNGNLKTIAGNLQGGFSGDGGPATQAGMGMQVRTGLAFDAAANLYVADGFNHRVRVIAPSGIINTFAGNGQATTAGDGGLAKNAGFSIPRGLLFDSHGDLFISDVADNRIREVLNAPPAINVAPSQMTFSANAGGARTPPQELTIDGPVSGVAFTITSSADWVVVSAGGLTPRLINVRADPSNLTAGPYQATLTITAPLANPSTITVQLTFNVSAGVPPVLATGKDALSFTFPRNPTTTGTQIVRVLNQGDGMLVFSAIAETATGGQWLKLSISSNSVTPQSPATVAVTANPSGLATGTYTGTVTVASSTTGTNIVIPVNLTVSSLDQAMRLSRPALSFTAVAGGGVVPASVFAVNNIGRGTTDFTVSTRTLAGGQQWLSATPTTGSITNGQTPVPITVTINQTGLAPGFYYGLVRVDSATAANSPQVVSIAIEVLPAGQDPGPVIEPSEIVFTAVAGAPPPGSRNLFVYNVSGAPQTYVSSVTATNANDQFSVVPGNSTLNLTRATRIVVQPLTSGLAAGVYDADLTLQFSDGLVRRVGMRTIVTPALPGFVPAATLLEARAVSGCTPTQLVPAITTLGQSFGVPAAWPVALEVQVTDDCGNALNAGDVTASFSNGDPQLSLLSVQGGTWQSTWQSGNGVGPVTLTVTANNSSGNLTGTEMVTGGLGASSLAPVLSGAVNGASFAPNSPLAPGSIISLFGSNLGNGLAGATALPLGTTLSDATVVMAGNALPLLFGSGGQINGVVSMGINTNTSQQILVQRNNTLSIPISVDVAPANPAVFPFPVPGDPPQQGAIVNAFTYVVADPKAPVSAGDVFAIFGTGLGAVDQTIADGAAAPSMPPANTVAHATVTIGGQAATVTFSGLSPGFAGLYQIDAVVPTGITPANDVPVIVSIAGEISPTVTIAVK